jgi:hypothetical protein
MEACITDQAAAPPAHPLLLVLLQVVPESWAGRGSTYAEFTAAMPERQCRYAGMCVGVGLGVCVGGGGSGSLTCSQEQLQAGRGVPSSWCAQQRLACRLSWQGKAQDVLFRVCNSHMKSSVHRVLTHAPCGLLPHSCCTVPPFFTPPSCPLQPPSV